MKGKLELDIMEECPNVLYSRRKLLLTFYLKGLRWREYLMPKARRLATQISTVIQGKDKQTNAPNRNDGDMCIVSNSKDICLTGRKLATGFITSILAHSYVGRLKENFKRSDAKGSC